LKGANESNNEVEILKTSDMPTLTINDDAAQKVISNELTFNI